MEEKNHNKLVEAIIYNPKRGVLLQKKTLDYIPFPGVWTFFGGHVEEGENRENALRREIKEETSINIKNFKLFTYREDVIPPTNYLIKRNIYEIIVDWKPSDIRLNEGAGFAYFDPSEFLKIKIDSLCLKVLEQWEKEKYLFNNLKNE